MHFTPVKTDYYVVSRPFSDRTGLAEVDCMYWLLELFDMDRNGTAALEMYAHFDHTPATGKEKAVL